MTVPLTREISATEGLPKPADLSAARAARAQAGIGYPTAPTTHAGVDAGLAGARREVLIASTLAGVGYAPLAMFRRIDRENLHRGVRYRVLLPDRARTTPGLACRLVGLAEAGAEVRTMPDVPMDAVVVDASLAVVPNEGQSGIAMFRLPSVVRTSMELFERVWPSAVALSTSELPDSAELGARERELLTLLSAGWTDESAASRMGISVRTVRRMVSVLMQRLGARSRFQTGVKAAERGWLACS